MHSELNSSINDIDKAKILNQLADAYKFSDPVLMREFANKALLIATKIGFNSEKATAYLNLGNASLIEGNYKQATDFFLKSKDVFENELSVTKEENEDLNNGLARAYGSLGIIYSEQSNYSQALKFHLKAVTIYENTNNLEKLAAVKNNIGIVHQSLGDDFKALNYFIDVLKIQKQIQSQSIATTYTNVGNIYLKQNDTIKAFESYSNALAMLQNSKDFRSLGELHNNLGLYYSKIESDEKALNSWTEAIRFFEEINNKFGLTDTYFYLGQFYFEQKQYDKAVLFAEQAKTIAQEIEVLEVQVNIEKLLSNIEEQRGNLSEAFQYFKNYNHLNDSLINLENVKNSLQAEMKFEFEKQESVQKAAFEKSQEIATFERKKHQSQLIFGFVLGLFILGFLFLIYNRKQLKKNLTLQKELAEYEQKALHLQMNPHFVFNCLGSISSFIVQNGTDSALKYLAKFSKLMRLTLEYSKESLIPIDKEIESLQNYLELEQLRFNHIFEFKISKSKEIEDDMALPPLLLQPFVENAIIHGLIPKKEKGVIEVDFYIKDASLICTVLDNGIGFENSQKIKENLLTIHKSMALEITKKRLELMEASTTQKSKLEIQVLDDENPHFKGTKVVLILPIQYIKNK
uniref:tetratricopeptide repeat-containing sensor histidine kinase n=1 Tax=Flavobacterium sp. TaxID=239 RepID=UPI0040499875